MKSQNKVYILSISQLVTVVRGAVAVPEAVEYSAVGNPDVATNAVFATPADKGYCCGCLSSLSSLMEYCYT